MSSYALRSKQEMPEISFEECARRLAEAERDLRKKPAVMASFLEIFHRFHPYVSHAAVEFVDLYPSIDGWTVTPRWHHQTFCCDFYDYTCEAERKAIKNYFERVGAYARR